MTNLPIQGRITSKTPDEWLTEYMPLLCMLLFANELVELVRRNADSKSGQTRTKPNERAGIAWSYLDRLEKCIRSYPAENKLLGDVAKLWRETARAEYVVPSGDGHAQILEVQMESRKHFFSKLKERVLQVLREKVKEDSQMNIDEFHILLLECLVQ